ncbi:MAG: hypothetical protein V1800_15315 [Candidatus Latescibacterota bacterium]
MPEQTGIHARLARYRACYSNPAPGGLLIVAHFPGLNDLVKVDLRDFDFDRESEHRRYWDIVVENMFLSIENHRRIDDDWIPGLVLHYGFGAFGAVYCDAQVTFTENTSYLDRGVANWDPAELPLYRKDRFWARIFVEAGRYLSAKGNGQFMVSPYPNPSPLDVANLLRGNDVFTDVYEQPEALKAFLEKATPAIIEHARAVEAALDPPWGGVLTFGGWIPKGLVLLEDAADLCSPSVYEEFGRPYTQTVIDAMGGGYIHHHSLGRQQYRAMATLSGLHVLQISSDPNATRPIQELDYLWGEVGHTMVELECEPNEICEHIQELKKGRAMLVADCKNRDEAEELVAFVRSNSTVF